MRKKFLLALAAVGAAILLPVAAMAAEGGTTIIDGTVTNSGHAVGGANVTVVCDGHTRNATTNSNGDYLVTFGAGDCPVAATAHVSASKSGKGSGSNSGPIGPTNSSQINIGIVDVAIPEFGTIASLLAVVGAAGVFMITRRRELGQN